MFDPQFNGPTTTTTPPQSPQDKSLRLDKKYVQSRGGILKVIQLICNFICFICIKVSTAILSPIFFNILYWLGIIISGSLLSFYTFHIIEKFDKIPWTKIEFFSCAILALGLIGTSIFATTIGESAGFAVGFFGLCAIIAYVYDGYLKYKMWKSGLPPQ